MSARGAIVFDLDGTLVDSAPDLHSAANAMLAGQGYPPLDLATVVSFVGHGIPALVAQIAEALRIAPGRQAAMQESLLAHYTAHPADRTNIYQGVAEALTGLREQGFVLGICTNKMTGLAQAILHRLDLSQHFGVVIGGDSLPQRKPDPAPLHAAFAVLNAGPVLFVGDSEVDAETAQRADVPFALFLRGYRKSAPGDLSHVLAFDDFRALSAFAESAPRPAWPRSAL